jgi:hypothetical protein
VIERPQSSCSPGDYHLGVNIILQAARRISDMNQTQLNLQNEGESKNPVYYSQRGDLFGVKTILSFNA